MLDECNFKIFCIELTINLDLLGGLVLIFKFSQVYITQGVGKSYHKEKFKRRWTSAKNFIVFAWRAWILEF